MTMHERRETQLDEIRALVARATPEQIRRLIEDIKSATPSERLN